MDSHTKEIWTLNNHSMERESWLIKKTLFMKVFSKRGDFSKEKFKVQRLQVKTKLHMSVKHKGNSSGHQSSMGPALSITLQKIIWWVEISTKEKSPKVFMFSRMETNMKEISHKGFPMEQELIRQVNMFRRMQILL